MKSLMCVLHTETNAFERLICANCLACMSYIAIVVGKARFNEDACCAGDNSSSLETVMFFSIYPQIFNNECIYVRLWKVLGH